MITNPVAKSLTQKQKKVLVVGSTVVDLTFYATKIPVVGETVTGRFVQGLGGKGFNQAVGARMAGARTAFISALGADAFAPQFEARLKELGIEHALETITDAATGAAAISVDEAGRNSIIVALGASDRLSPAFLDRNATMFDEVGVLLLQFETNLAVMEHAIRLVKKRSPGAIVIHNPAPARARIPASMLEQIDYFTPNETELATISGVALPADWRESDVKSACSEVHVRGAILATLGERGCYYFRRGASGAETKSLPAFPVKAIDTAGAGDAFNGAFAAGLLRYKGDWERAARFASAAAAISVTRPGTSSSIARFEEIHNFMNPDAPYPAHWWKPVPTEGAPEWELLPQAAGPGEVIISKRHELGVLSNFWPAPFEFRGKKYASMEGWWQAQFYPESPDDPRAKHPGLEWPHTREQVAGMSMFDAWFAGVKGYENMLAMGINYVTFEGKQLPYWIPEKGEHHALVVEAMRAKLEQNPIVKQALLSTGELTLRADHEEPADAPPCWEYYRIWMELRDELRSRT